MKNYLLLLALAVVTGSFAQVLEPPVDFESGTLSYTFVDFDGGQAAKIANPQMSGINTSANVGQMVKNAGQVWGGSYLEMDNPIDFSTNKIFKMKVYSPAVGQRVLLKVEDPMNGAIFFEKEDTSTVANAWEELTFDFSAINTANTYQKIVLIWELGTMGDGSANFTFLFDDIELVAGGTPLAQIDLPITFDDSMVDYTMTSFGGNSHSLIADPVNAANTVTEAIKTNAAQLWAGTTISTANGLANAIPFSATETSISIRVWSPDAGIPVRLKAEDHTNNTISVETETVTTTSGEWETMVFDFSNEVMGTSALDLMNTYDMLSVFFNFGTDGATAGEKIYLFDDVEFIPTCTNSTASITESVLDTYTAPSGAVYTTSGMYNDTISNAAGCDSIITIDLTVNYTGISETDLNAIQITPNPASSQVTISIAEGNLNAPLMIMDQAGRIVVRLETTELETIVDISELESGLYYVQLGELNAVKLLKK